MSFVAQGGLPLTCLWRGGRIRRWWSAERSSASRAASPEESLQALVRAVYQSQANGAGMGWREMSALYLERFSSSCLEAWAFEEERLLPEIAGLGLSWRFLCELMYSEHRLIAQKTSSFEVVLLNVCDAPNATWPSASSVLSELNGLERTFYAHVKQEQEVILLASNLLSRG